MSRISISIVLLCSAFFYPNVAESDVVGSTPSSAKAACDNGDVVSMLQTSEVIMARNIVADGTYQTSISARPRKDPAAGDTPAGGMHPLDKQLSAHQVVGTFLATFLGVIAVSSSLLAGKMLFDVGRIFGKPRQTEDDDKAASPKRRPSMSQSPGAVARRLSERAERLLRSDSTRRSLQASFAEEGSQTGLDSTHEDIPLNDPEVDDTITDVTKPSPRDDIDWGSPTRLQSAVRDAADSVPAPPPELVNSSIAAVHAENRLVAALVALQDVRSAGIEQLCDLEGQFALQWWLVNIGATMSLCWDVASACTAVQSPMISAATGFVAATITVTCLAYDTIGENMKTRKVRHLSMWIDRNSDTCADVEAEWQDAHCLPDDEQVLSAGVEVGPLSSAGELLKSIGGNCFCIAFDITSSTMSCFPSIPVKFPLFLSWIGVLGCFFVTLAFWLATKQSQRTTQEMVAALQANLDRSDDWLKKHNQGNPSGPTPGSQAQAVKATAAGL